MVTTIMGMSFRGNRLVTEGLAQKIFGVGRHTAGKVCAKLGLYPGMRMHQLDEPQIYALTKELSELKLQTDLKNEILGNIRGKFEMGHIEGLRHSQGLPVRSGRTQSNASTAKKLNTLHRRFKY